jgi:hypothetical protein
LFTKTEQSQDWENYVNVCASITNLAGAFPEKQLEFKCLIVPLIKVVSNKTDQVRKSSAVLLSTLSKNEENKKWM